MASRITATFEVVTPLFLGGADPARTVELRAPSIKGALRFWWRSLAWSRHPGTTDAEKLQDIRHEEQQIFGSAGNDAGASGRSSFGLRVRWLGEDPQPLIGSEPWSLISGQPGAGYLGYGVIDRGAGEQPRPCYRPGARFALTFYPLSRLEPNLQPSLLAAVKLFGLFGGLGGRSRRGWGSVTLTDIDGDEPWVSAKSLREYGDRLKSILGAVDSAPGAPYSAFDRGTRLQIFGFGNDPLVALDRLGQVYKQYRSDNRTYIFGLPHSRFRGDAGRRASPLLFHLHRLESRQYAIAATFLRSPFLEGDPGWNEYEKIEQFLNDLPEALKAKGFRQALPVLPVAGGLSA